jgi:flagellar biogenesis protein FliO
MEANAANGETSTPETPWMTNLKALWQRTWRVAKTRKTRRLRVCETLSLGERRFVAVIEFDRQEFLVGGTGNSLELLARLQGDSVITPPAEPRPLRPV